MADVAPVPAGLALEPQELQLRATILGEGGRLAAALRALEAQPWRDGTWLQTCWRWVQCLLVVRGFRGSTTVTDYVEAVTRFVVWLEAEGLALRAVKARDLDAWQRSLYVQRRLSASTRRLALMAVRSLYSYLATRDEVPDVTKGYAAPKRVVTQARKYNAPQLRAMFDAVKLTVDERQQQRDRAMLLLLLAAGLRREEIASLRIDQLELRSDRKGAVHVFGKGSKERTVPIEGPVVRQLVLWLELRSRMGNLATDAVFVSLARRVSGTALSVRAIERIVKRVAKSAGLGSWGVHRFRVTFATMLYDDGTDIERIRVLMGHESIETTRRYLAVSQRMNKHTLKAHRQHAALGTVPDDLPLWAQDIERRKHGTSILPGR